VHERAKSEQEHLEHQRLLAASAASAPAAPAPSTGRKRGRPPLDADADSKDAKEAAAPEQPAAPAPMADEERGPPRAEVVVPPAIPESTIPLPQMSEEARVNLLADLIKRVKLSTVHHPSVCFFTFLNSQRIVCTIAISSDASLVAAGCSDSSIRVWSLLEPHRNAAEAAARAQRQLVQMASGIGTADAKLAAEAAQADAESAVDLAEPPYLKLVGHSGPVYSVAFSPDNRYLLSASADGTVRLWLVETASNLVCYKGHNYPLFCVEFAPVGFYFATGGMDRTGRLWSTDRVAPLRLFAGHTNDIECVKFHPNCNYVATGSSDKSVRLWSLQTGECVRIFVGHTGTVRCLAFSPDGRYLASGGEDRRVLVWDLPSGKPVFEFVGHRDTVTSVDFSGEGTVLASASLDCTIRIWDARSPSVVAAQTGASRRKAEAAASVLQGRDRLIKTYLTKGTPVLWARFTPRNLLLAGGIFAG